MLGNKKKNIIISVMIMSLHLAGMHRNPMLMIDTEADTAQ